VATLTIRNLPAETHRALKERARSANRSMEAEVRAILEQQIRPPDRTRLGSRLRQIGQEVGGIDLDVARSKAASEPIDFS
jgi:plasmid stability protein